MKQLLVIIFLLVSSFVRAEGVDNNVAHTHHEIIAPTTAVPGESLYQLSLNLTTHQGNNLTLNALRGQPVIVTMFYASCQNVCPLIASTIQSMEKKLTTTERAKLRVLMVTFDPTRDSVEQLNTFAQQHTLDPTRWLLVRTEESGVRQLAAVLGIRYRELENGVFNHSTVIALLDQEGVIRARTSTINDIDSEFMETLRAALK